MPIVSPSSGQRLELPIPRFGQQFDLQAWQADGFASADEARHWSERSCGLACVRMCLAHAGRPVPTLAELLRAALALQGYSPRGWIHAKLAALGAGLGLPGEAIAADATRLREELRLGRAPIVSVSSRLPQDGRRGGHLIVLAGLDDDDRARPLVGIRDPSRWGEQHRWVPWTRLLASYSGRAIAWRPPAEPPPA